jgi:thioredoxin reductase (NADPH)
MPKKKHYKLVILGSGPAGLTAAIYASRASLEPLVVEGGGGGDPTDVAGGQLMLTTEVENFPGFPSGIMGPDLMGAMRKQAERFGSEFAEFAFAAKVDLAQRPFTMELSSGETVTADALIVATGARARWLEVPEELEFRTKGWGVSACATCDGFFYKGKDVVVVGGGDTAMEEASFLTKFANKVTIVHRRDGFRASKPMLERARKNPKIEWVTGCTIARYVGGAATKLTAVVLKNVQSGGERELPAQGVFMAIGHEPNTTVLKGQLEMDGNGYLLTRDGTTATSVEGVFAAGDVADHRYRQAITAAGSGCMAAIDAERYLSH